MRNGTLVRTNPSTSARVLVALAVPTLLLTGCGVDVGATVGTDDATATETSDEAMAGDTLGMCAPGVPDCVDMVVRTDGDEPAVGDDPIVGEDIVVTDALPPDTRPAELAHDPAGESWPIFLQQAVVRDASVDVVFSGGTAPCFVVDRVETDESESGVIVTVFVRTEGDASTDCSAQEVTTQVVTVDLAAPLGDRALLDGSRTVQPE